VPLGPILSCLARLATRALWAPTDQALEAVPLQSGPLALLLSCQWAGEKWGGDRAEAHGNQGENPLKRVARWLPAGFGSEEDPLFSDENPGLDGLGPHRAGFELENPILRPGRCRTGGYWL